jgi:hypothetical protein
MTDDLSREVERWRRDPAYFASSMLGVDTLWRRQVEILEALRDHRRVAVPSCHESGKTYCASVAAVWWLLSHQPSKVITTAPTQRQVKDLLWSEIRARHAGMLRRLGGNPGLGDPTSTHWQIDADWFAVGFATSADKAQESATRVQGYHSESLLVILDEAGGIAREVWTAIEGLLTSGNARVLAIGQPQAGTEFERVCRSPDWRTLPISALDCPNLQPGAARARWGVTPLWVEQMRRRFGEGSVVYQTKVLGEFPKHSDDTLMSLSEVERALSRKPPNENPARPSIGVDVARFGSDETVLVALRGPAALKVETFSGQDLMRTTGSIIRLAGDVGIGPEEAGRIAIDDTGIGGGCTDRLRELGWRIGAVNFGSSPKSARNETRYLNRRTEIWWNLRDFIQDEACLGDLDPDTKDILRADLCAPRYIQKSDGRIALESKADIKARVGRSPDYGDALALAVAAGASGRTGYDPRPAQQHITDPYEERDRFDEALQRGEKWAVDRSMMNDSFSDGGRDPFRDW